MLKSSAWDWWSWPWRATLWASCFSLHTSIFLPTSLSAMWNTSMALFPRQPSLDPWVESFLNERYKERKVRETGPSLSFLFWTSTVSYAQSWVIRNSSSVNNAMVDLNNEENNLWVRLTWCWLWWLWCWLCLVNTKQTALWTPFLTSWTLLTFPALECPQSSNRCVGCLTDAWKSL